MRVICEEIDGWPQELSRKKKFWKNSRKKVVLEWEKEIAIMHMYPIQTVGSSCPTFPASTAKKKQCFHRRKSPETKKNTIFIEQNGPNPKRNFKKQCFHLEK